MPNKDLSYEIGSEKVRVKIKSGFELDSYFVVCVCVKNR